jgi:hypothetical protein
MAVEAKWVTRAHTQVFDGPDKIKNYVHVSARKNLANGEGRVKEQKVPRRLVRLMAQKRMIFIFIQSHGNGI